MSYKPIVNDLNSSRYQLWITLGKPNYLVKK
jgi:hypothetical protein